MLTCLLIFISMQMTFNYLEQSPNVKFMERYGFSTAAVRNLFGNTHNLVFCAIYCRNGMLTSSIREIRYQQRYGFDF